MKLRKLFLLLLLMALVGNLQNAFAEQLLFQRGTTLYTSEMDGTEARPLFDITSAEATPTETESAVIWAAAPDGRRVVWMHRGALVTGAASSAINLRDRPVEIHLSDLMGQHQKMLLSTSGLRDRQGKKVTSIGISLPGTPEEIPVRKFESWEPVSLTWSADSRTLYLSCLSLLPDRALKTTVAVDAASGAALVDADGRWKTVAPMTDINASGVLIIGVGTVQNQKGTTEAPSTRYAPLYLINLAAGTQTPLYDAAAQDPVSLPDYAFTKTPALSGNDNRYIAFASRNKGLWLFDRTTQEYRPLLDRNVTRPRWTAAANSLYFLEERPAQEGKVSHDLYGADFTALTGQIGLPRPLLQGVDWFDIVPE